MGDSFRRACARVVVAAALLVHPSIARAADPDGVEELRRDLDALKKRLAEIEALTRKQQDMIRTRSAQISRDCPGYPCRIVAARPPCARDPTSGSQT